MFKKVPQSRIYENIVDQILESILRGDLKPNDKLPSEHELCDVFGVSRVTVREAIRALEHYGIVEVLQGSLGGTYIKEVNLEDITEQVINVTRMVNVSFSQLTDARIGIECAAINQLKYEEISPDVYEKLENNVDSAEEFFKKNKKRERLICNFEFHATIVRMTENPIYIITDRLIHESAMYFFESVDASDAMIQKTLDQHREIINLLRAGDFRMASKINRIHIKEVSGLIIEKSISQSQFLNRGNFSRGSVAETSESPPFEKRYEEK